MQGRKIKPSRHICKDLYKLKFRKDFHKTVFFDIRVSLNIIHSDIFGNLAIQIFYLVVKTSVVDPDPYWECGSGSSSMEIDKNLKINLVSFLSNNHLYLRWYVFGPIAYFKYILHVKNQPFVTLKPDQDPHPDPHWFRFWIRIIRIEIKSWVGSSLKPMRIHNTARKSLFWTPLRICFGKTQSHAKEGNSCYKKC